MRLLNVQSKGLEEYITAIPPYAILSHCWATEEITYEDICRPEGTAYKAGWAKIDGACNEAKGHGYDFIWIDTCCIDKSSSTELSEAINSMFNWYRNAATCFAYLSDVKSDADLIESRWFSRGWTLQELLAPKIVYFYTSDWKCIGDKEALAVDISGKTSIPQDILVDVEFMWYTSIARRMSWAAGRDTTRVEDTAYCLLGIFGVNMPLLYGEGDRAFLRLQEEIIKISDDQSILVWDTKEERRSALASKPADFISTSVVDSTPSSDVSDKPYTMTHKGLSICLPMVQLGAYHGSQPIYLGILNCNRENEFSRQVGIYLCLADTTGTKMFIRCKYRASYYGTIAVEKVPARARSVYIQNHSRVFYRRRPGLILQVSSSLQDVLEYQLAQAQVRGIKASWNPSSNTARIVRTVNAVSHDIAAGFVFYRPKTAEGFIIVVYFPHRVYTNTELAGIKVVPKPDDWPFEDWLLKTSNDLSSNNLQETWAKVDKPYFAKIRLEHEESSDHAFSAELRSEVVLNQTVHTLLVDHVRYTPPASTFIQAQESRKNNEPDASRPGHWNKSSKVATGINYLNQTDDDAEQPKSDHPHLESDHTHLESDHTHLESDETKLEPKIAPEYIGYTMRKAAPELGKRSGWGNVEFTPYAVSQEDIPHGATAQDAENVYLALKDYSQQQHIVRFIKDRNRIEQNPLDQWRLAHIEIEWKIYTKPSVYKLVDHIRLILKRTARTQKFQSDEEDASR